MPLDPFRVGQEIGVRTWLGGIAYGVITAVKDDIRNGRPGVEYDAYGEGPHWCYLDQIRYAGPRPT